MILKSKTSSSKAHTYSEIPGPITEGASYEAWAENYYAQGTCKSRKALRRRQQNIIVNSKQHTVDAPPKYKNLSSYNTKKHTKTGLALSYHP